nr:TPA_asm: VP1 [Cat associated lyon-IARC polyomavirus]
MSQLVLSICTLIIYWRICFYFKWVLSHRKLSNLIRKRHLLRLFFELLGWIINPLKTPPPKKDCSQTYVKCPKRCPKVPCVPKLLIKGGIEVLETVSGPDSITQIELYLQPRMGVNTYDIERYSNWYGYSYEFHPKDVNDVPSPETLPSYSAARVPLPPLNEDMTCNMIMMWEAVSVKTEVIGINTLINVHKEKQLEIPQYGEHAAGIPIQGPNYHFFSIGGEPLDLQGIVADYRTMYPEGENKPINIKTVTKTPMTPKNQGMDPTAKTKLLKDGYYPIEIWCPDPSRNENSRYFGSFTGGTDTPPVLQFTNTLTTVLLDENGIGPLCKADGLFVAAADICGFFHQASGMRYRGLPRYFNVTLRKRWVKNPYGINSLINTLFNNFVPQLKGQPMTGDNSQVEEVRVYDGREQLPGGLDLPRIIEQFKPKTFEVNVPVVGDVGDHVGEEHDSDTDNGNNNRDNDHDQPLINNVPLITAIL